MRKKLYFSYSLSLMQHNRHDSQFIQSLPKNSSMHDQNFSLVVTQKYLTNEVAALTSQLALCTKRFDSRLVKIGCVSKRIFERWKSIFHPYLSEDCTPIRRSTLNVVTKPQRSDVGSPKVSLIFHNVQGKKNHKICSGF